MNVQKSIVGFITAFTLFTASTAALAADMPPPPPGNLDKVTIYNQNVANIQFKYNTSDACVASHAKGNLVNGASVKSNVTCPWGADGVFNFTDGSGNLIGTVDAGYAPCRLINATAPYQVSVTNGTQSCSISIQNVSGK